MEITQRKMVILATLIKLYLDAGEPVGSKAVLDALGMQISSATIRGELAELAEMGYLLQPHTSAGRVPTGRAYRLYIDKLMRKQRLSDDDKRRIDAMLPKTGDSPDSALATVAQSLADWTAMAAIASVTPDGGDRVRRVDLIPLGTHTALVVLLTTDGAVRSRLCRCDVPLSSALLELFGNVTAELVCGEPVASLGPAKLQTVATALGEHVLALSSPLFALFEVARNVGESQLQLAGESNLLRQFDVSGGGAGDLLSLLAHARTMVPDIRRAGPRLAAVIGDENPDEALRIASLIFAKYRLGGRVVGAIGVIGPLRMDYEHIIPAIEYFAQKLSEYLSRFLDP